MRIDDHLTLDELEAAKKKEQGDADDTVVGPEVDEEPITEDVVREQVQKGGMKPLDVWLG